MSVLLKDPIPDPGIDWQKYAEGEKPNLTVDISEDFEHTPVDILIFASDPQRGREYEMFLKESYNPGETMSDIAFQEYMAKANEYEIECWKLPPRQDLTSFDKAKESGYFLTWPSIDQHDGRAMGGDKVAHEIRKLGYTVQVIHNLLHVSEDTVHKIIQKFVGENTKAVMFGQVFSFHKDMFGLMNTVFFPPSRQHKIKEWILEQNPTAKLVMGGAKFNYTKEFGGVSKNKTPLDDIDIRMFGWADVTIKDMLMDLEEGNPKQFYSDPKSMLDIYNSSMEYFDEDVILPSARIGLELGRGCIFKCSFCEFDLIGKTKGTYTRSTSRLEDELKRNWEEYGVHRYWITDDTLNDDTAKLERMAEIRTRTGIPFQYACFLRLDLQHRLKQTDLLVESGIEYAHYGIETLNPDSASAIGKGWHPEEQMAFIRELKADKFKNVFCHSNFMYGLPEDSLEIIKDMHYKLIDIEYNALDQIVVQSYTIREPKATYPKSDPTKTTSTIQDTLDEQGYTVTTDRKVWDSILMTKNKHGLSTQQSHWISVITSREFRINKYWRDHFDPIKKANDLRLKMKNDYQDYFNRIFDIKSHSRYETVTLFTEDQPKTLSVQEYKELI